MKSDIFETIKDYEKKAQKLIIDAQVECKEMTVQFETQKNVMLEKNKSEIQSITELNDNKFNAFKKETTEKYTKKFDLYNNQMKNKYLDGISSVIELLNSKIGS